VVFEAYAAAFRSEPKTADHLKNSNAYPSSPCTLSDPNSIRRIQKAAAQPSNATILNALPPHSKSSNPKQNVDGQLIETFVAKPLRRKTRSIKVARLELGRAISAVAADA